MLGRMPPWDLRRYRFAVPVWWAARRKSQRRRIARVCVLAAAAILYGIAVWLGR
jgi:hypothetical protein